MDQGEDRKLIHIDAPVEKVFAYMNSPEHLPEFWPSFVEVRNVQPLPGGGNSFDWTYKMGGMKFDGRTETKEYYLNQRTVDKSEGGIPSLFNWIYQKEEGGMRLTVQAEYTIPVVLLGKLVEPLIVKLNEHEAETILANLKALMEI